MEYTGTSYRCRKCKWVWHYNDTGCPNCGEDMEIDEKETLYPEGNPFKGEEEG